MLGLFEKLFGNNKQNQRNIDIKDVNHSNINILQVEKIDISSLINSPYKNVIIGNVLRNHSKSSLTGNISYRSNCVISIVKYWETNVWINLYGGFDTGKTQLSLLIEKYLAYKNILNYNFKELSDSEFQSIISSIFNEILSQNSKSEIQLIILDDLPKFGLDENVNLLFTQFIEYCKSNEIRVLSTSNYKIHSKITKTITNDFLELQIPLLTKEEIEEIILTYQNDEKLTKFSTIVEVISKGYPIYVQIICKYLEVHKWKITDENLMQFISV